MPAYFFRDPDGQLPVTATLYHEVSHQLLFETAGPNAYTRNVGNYWVFEGLGTYFETVVAAAGRLARGRRTGRPPHRGGDQVAGGSGTGHPAGRVHRPRPECLQQRHRDLSPLPAGHGVDGLSHAMARGTYRDAFLDYVRDAYRGRIKHGAGRSLQDRLGQPYATLDGQFRAFLKKGEERLHGGQAAVARPGPSETIRTVPRQ